MVSADHHRRLTINMKVWLLAVCSRRTQHSPSGGPTTRLRHTLPWTRRPEAVGRTCTEAPEGGGSGHSTPKAAGVGCVRGFAGQTETAWRRGITRKSPPDTHDVGRRYQRVTGLSPLRRPAHARRVPCSGCHGEGKGAFENTTLSIPHIAVNDYRGYCRVMDRVTFVRDRPYFAA